MSIKDALQKAGIQLKEKPKSRPVRKPKERTVRTDKLPNPLNVGKTHLNLQTSSEDRLSRVLSMGLISLNYPRLGKFSTLTHWLLFVGFGKGHPSYRDLNKTKMRELLARRVIDYDDPQIKQAMLDGYRAIASEHKWIEEALVANTLRFECYSVRTVEGVQVPLYHPDSRTSVWAVEELARELKAKAAGKQYKALVGDYSWLGESLVEMMEEVVKDTPAEEVKATTEEQSTEDTHADAKPFVPRVKDKDFTAGSEVDEVGFSMEEYSSEETAEKLAGDLVNAAIDKVTAAVAEVLTEPVEEATESVASNDTVASNDAGAYNDAGVSNDTVDPADIEVDDFFHEDGTPIKAADFFPETGNSFPETGNGSSEAETPTTL